MSQWRVIAGACLFFLIGGIVSTGDRASARATTLVVAAGDNLQDAINAAQAGDTILIEAGATFQGNFTLPVKSGTAFITIRSSARDEDLPGPGQRITPAHAPLLPKLQSTNAGPALRTAPGAHHWRLQFLHFPPTMLGYGEIIQLGDGSQAQNQLAQVAHTIELDRVYVHGHPLYGQKRGIALNGQAITIRNSHVSDIKSSGADAQAIAGWNGPGPFIIENNYLEASGENFLLGGSDPAIPNLVSADVTVRFNYMSRPMSWKDPIIPTPAHVRTAVNGGGTLSAGIHSYQVLARRQIGSGTTGRSTVSDGAAVTVAAGASVTVTWSAVPDATEYRVHVRRPDGSQRYWTMAGTHFTDTGNGGTSGSAPTGPGNRWLVKNIFELKNARRVLVEYNVFENNWPHGQPGYAILFTPRNQDGGCTWCVVEDVDFQYNVVRNTSAGVNVTGYDSPNVSRQTRNIIIRHNLFYDITRALGGNGWFMQIGDQPRDIIVDHNTVDADGSAVVYVHGGTSAAPRQVLGFRFTNNATRHGNYGINGANFSYGNGIIEGYFPDSVVTGNWLQGALLSRYPPGNHVGGPFVAAFVDSGAHNYQPSAGSILIGNASNGANIGADLSRLLPGVQGVVEGRPGVGTPRPPPNLRILTTR